MALAASPGRIVAGSGESDRASAPDLGAMALEALDALAVGVAVVGTDSRILLENRRFRELLGSSAMAAALQGWDDDLASREIALECGRRVRLAAARIPQGLLVSAEDLRRSVDPKRVADLARTDPLTGLGNRAMFQERLAELAARRDAKAGTVAALTVGLGRFKDIRESLGHPVGDALQRLAADRLRQALGPDDLAARFGGDEFGLIHVGQAQPQSAAALAERVIELLGRPYVVEGHLLNTPVNVGIALMPAEKRDSSHTLRGADLALCRARQAGHGTFRFFEAAMDEQVQTRRRLELDLRRALAMREFVLLYQPQLNLASHEITGFEVLLRWYSPQHGIVPPSVFIPLAEEFGLIGAIGEWIIRTACREAAGWQRPLSVAINVSAAQFGASNLVPVILSALGESRLDPHRLELEITESVLLKDDGSALDVLRMVRQIGVHVSMDDFGTGYSSLSRLHSFPFDKIKVDQSFVRVGPSDASATAIVRAIAALGRSLGMAIIAEGVETAEQFDRVAAAGCTDVQGYLISPPVPADRIADVVREHSASPART
ncbi:putative bifunctional diguanylate cyclase/phosphodiesterase [Blastochloris sulfoviridis]|uniref:Bifunctional diguanylate cyclase/phosphodiesterase n=1 Tax=Blastochloris sulfoviridis TaxID=50712 RepID=A0A5M6HQG9_9HYPH|nr:bifunctional diguanylate cyclase/phosphodiesterase [Blastochloris sulfoviridis]KAA5598122.1 bifunctional diguanylate cyclase/phosphodiesterase [Blastochloris sulfoviridis]